MRRTFVSAAIALYLASMNPASAHDGRLTPGQQKWVDAIKLCLVAKKVPLAGDRPGCFITRELRVQCLGPHREAGAACTEEHASRAPRDRIRW